MMAKFILLSTDTVVYANLASLFADTRDGYIEYQMNLMI